MSTPMDAVSVVNEEHESIPAVDNSVQYPGCEQTFNRPGDLKRHKCLAERFFKNSREPSNG